VNTRVSASIRDAAPLEAAKQELEETKPVSFPGRESAILPG
jgi:hypothetical protein